VGRVERGSILRETGLAQRIPWRLNMGLHIEPPQEPVEGPSVWTGAEMAARSDWIYVLDASEVGELKAAADNAAATGKPMEAVQQDDFPLSKLGSVLADVAGELEEGRGFVLLRGLPINEHPLERTALIYWGLARHLGVPVQQNGKGELLTHVRDVGGREGQFDGKVNMARGYNTTKELGYHTDSSDVVGLLCLQAAKVGGLSTIASAGAVHNEILRTRPDLLDLMYQVYPADNYGEQGAGHPPIHYSSICTYYQQKLSFRYIPNTDKVIKKYPELGVLPEGFEEMPQLIQELAHENHLDMEFEPGDLQLLNNYAVLHARTAFEDHPEPERRRDLLRVWLTLHNARDLPITFGRNPGVTDEFGARGFLPGTGRAPIIV
jgi:hypothetical protein